MKLILFFKKILGRKLTAEEQFYKTYGQTKEEFHAEVDRYNRAHKAAVARANKRFIDEHSTAMTKKFIDERKSLW